MLITSFSIRGIAHFEFIPQGQAVSQAYCVEIFTRLHAAVQRKSPELRPNSSFINYDRASANRALCEAVCGKKNLLLDWSTALTYQIWLPMTFGSFQN